MQYWLDQEMISTWWCKRNYVPVHVMYIVLFTSHVQLIEFLQYTVLFDIYYIPIHVLEDKTSVCNLFRLYMTERLKWTTSHRKREPARPRVCADCLDNKTSIKLSRGKEMCIINFSGWCASCRPCKNVFKNGNTDFRFFVLHLVNLILGNCSWLFNV